MKCILHVGVEKTGTTAIQETLSGFDDGQTFYADLGHPNHSLAFETLFRLNDKLCSHWRGLGYAPQEMIDHTDSLMTAALARGPERRAVIFSGENISLFDPGALGKMRARLESACDAFEVVMFVRDPLSWAASLIQENSKHGQSLSDMVLPSFESRYGALRSIFAESEIRIVDYQAPIRAGRDSVTHFCDLAGLDISGIYTRTVSSKKSMSDTAAKLLLRVNELTMVNLKGPPLKAGHYAFVAWVKRVFEHDGGIRAADYVGKCNADDYRFLRETFGIDYPEESRLATAALSGREELGADTIATLRDFLDANNLTYDPGDDLDAALTALHHWFVAEEFRKRGAVGEPDLAAERHALEMERASMAAELDQARDRLSYALANPVSVYLAKLDYTIHKTLAGSNLLPREMRERLRKAAKKRRERWVNPGDYPR